MPNLVKPQDAFCVRDRKTGISCLTTSSQTITNSQAISQTDYSKCNTVSIQQMWCVSRNLRERTEGCWGRAGMVSKKGRGRGSPPADCERPMAHAMWEVSGGFWARACAMGIVYMKMYFGVGHTAAAERALLSRMSTSCSPTARHYSVTQATLWWDSTFSLQVLTVPHGAHFAEGAHTTAGQTVVT